MSTLKTRVKKIGPFYNLYLFFFNKKEFLHHKREKQFFKNLGKFKLIFDIGANKGSKTALFNWLGSKVIAVEPDDLSYNLLATRFKTNNKITVLHSAVSDTIGKAEFFLNEPGSAFNTLSLKWKESLEDKTVNRWHTETIFKNVTEVKTITLDYLIKKYGKPCYIKIDVEGHELACIKGLTQGIAVISFEANLPEFKTETLQIIEHLKNIDRNTRFNYIINDENFEYKDHIHADEFYNFISNTDLKFMDIFSFMDN